MLCFRFSVAHRTKKQLQGWCDPTEATDRLVILTQPGRMVVFGWLTQDGC